MSTIIFVTVETEPLERFDFSESAVVADLLCTLEGRGVNVTELQVFKENSHEPLERQQPLHGHDHPVFHVNKHREIKVEVHYNLKTFQRRFPPSATIAKVTRWAVDEAHLGKEEAEEHVLQISGTRDQPALATHLGTLVRHGCEIGFDLVRKKLIQG